MASVAGGRPVSAPAKGIQNMPATSSWIAGFEYDSVNLRLTTHLKSGAIYQHAFVLPSEFLALQTSQNHAKHWADHIKGKKQSIRVKNAKAPKGELKHPGRSPK